MRTIAAKAGVGLSNIYNYFKNKDDIFREVLSPVMAALNNILEEHNNEEHLNIHIFTSQEYVREQTLRFVELFTKFKDEIKILFFQSHGSGLESFTEEYTEKHTRQGMEYLRLMKEKYPEVNSDLSDFFIHTLSSWWISTLTELVMHDLERDELERFIGEYMEFGTGGWKRIMNVN
jgi:AcrR family transcriptional regulator